MGVLLYLNWRLTIFTVVMLAAFGSMMAIAFKKLRPIFRERSVINAEVTGRLGESLGGVRIVKVYTAEEREDATFTSGVERLFDNVQAHDHRHVGGRLGSAPHRRHDRRAAS